MGFDEEFQASLTGFVVGDSGVGKSTFIRSSSEESSELLPGLARASSEVKTEDGQSCRVTLLDSSPDESPAKRNKSWRSASTFVLLFSLLDPDSLKSVEKKWIPRIRQFNVDAVFVLVGTKADLRDNVKKSECVSTKRGQAFADRVGAVGYFECSAKDVSKVTKIFHHTAMISVKRQSKRNLSSSSAKFKRLRTDSDNEKDSCCCTIL